MIKVQLTEEAGYTSALLGISLSYNADVEKMPSVANRLKDMDGGHNKFLEQIQVWLDMTAPRYFWQQFDTYRVGTSKSSGSTMHTILKTELTQPDFALPVPEAYLSMLNSYRTMGQLDQLKNVLGEGYLQRRIVNTNYKVLRNMITQRHNHKLKEWREFCQLIPTIVQHPELLTKKES